MQETVVDDLNGLIRQSEQRIALNDSLSRLKTNPDFIKVIEKGYLTDLALQLVRRKGQDSCIGSNADMVEAMLMGIGKLHHYFDSIQQQALIAQQSIIDANRAIDEISYEEGTK